MSTTIDERKHCRQLRDEKVVFQIRSSAHGTLPPGLVIRCRTKDVSPRGMRIKLDRPLSEGSLVELGIEISDRPGVFFLAGEVKWCKVLEKGKHHLVGLDLNDGDSDDFKLWQGVLDGCSPVKCDPGRA